MKRKNRIIYKVVGWTWWNDPDYIDAPLTDEVVDAVAQEIRNNGYCFGGDAHQNHSGCVPVLNTGQAVRCSMRVWGTIMARANFEGSFSLDYMGWYTNNCIQDDAIKYPNEDVDESLFIHPHYFKTHIKTNRFIQIKNEGKMIDVLASYDELYNVEVSDLGILSDYDAITNDAVLAEVVKVTRFNSPQEFINSELFKETDLVNLKGEELMIAINSARDNVRITNKDGVTVYHYKLIELMS